MADTFDPSYNEEELAKAFAEEASKNDDLTEHIQESSLEILKARFGVAEEDESIRSEGFELAEKGGLIRKPRPENAFGYYLAGQIDTREDIKTDAESELSNVFDSARSQHDSDAVDFRDLGVDKPEKKPDEPVKEPKKELKPEPEKKKRGRPRKNTVIEETEEIKLSEPGEGKLEEADEISGDETVQMIRKYNTHTKVVFEDKSIDDGIKRNSDDELESLFAEKQERRKLWSRKKK